MMGAQLHGRELIMMPGLADLYRFTLLPSRWSLRWKLF
jgi:hypothetical protein